MSDTHFVLIHGAYHRAWHLQLLRDKLEEAGYAASSIDLPACNDPIPDAGGLELDTAAIKQAIEAAATTSTNIFPVFHSYAGIPGSEAVAQLSTEISHRIKNVIYLAAEIPTQSGSMVPQGGAPPPWVLLADDGKSVSVPNPTPIFYHDLSPALAQLAASKVVPHATSSFTMQTQHTGWRMFPSTYILCSRDLAITPSRTAERFAAMGEEDKRNWKFFTIEGGHSPFLSKPGETAELLRRIAGEDLVVNAREGLVVDLDS